MEELAEDRHHQAEEAKEAIHHVLEEMMPILSWILLALHHKTPTYTEYAISDAITTCTSGFYIHRSAQLWKYCRHS